MSVPLLDVGGIVENVAAGLIVAGLGALGTGIIRTRGDPVESISRALLALVPSLVGGFLWTMAAIMPWLPFTQTPFSAWIGPLTGACMAVFAVICVWHSARSVSLLASVGNQLGAAFVSYPLGLLVIALQVGGGLALVKLVPGGIALLWVVGVAVVHMLLILRLSWRVGERSTTLSSSQDLGGWEVWRVYFVGRKFR